MLPLWPPPSRQNLSADLRIPDRNDSARRTSPANDDLHPCIVRRNEAVRSSTTIADGTIWWTGKHTAKAGLRASFNRSMLGFRWTHDMQESTMLTEADLIAWDVEAVQLVEAHTALLAQATKAGDVDGMVRHGRRLLMCKPLLGMGEQYRRVLYPHSC